MPMIACLARRLIEQSPIAIDTQVHLPDSRSFAEASANVGQVGCEETEFWVGGVPSSTSGSG